MQKTNEKRDKDYMSESKVAKESMKTRHVNALQKVEESEELTESKQPTQLEESKDLN